MGAHAMVLLLALAASPWSPEQADAQGKRFRAADWTTTTHLADVDPAVVATLHARIAERIADHGEPFNPTDVQAGEELPRVRLVLAGHTRNQWFACLEVGGVAHRLYFTMFDVDGKSAHLVLFALGSAKVVDTPSGWSVDLAELKSAFRENRLRPSDPEPYLLK